MVGQDPLNCGRFFATIYGQKSPNYATIQLAQAYLFGQFGIGIVRIYPIPAGIPLYLFDSLSQSLLNDLTRFSQPAGEVRAMENRNIMLLEDVRMLFQKILCFGELLFYRLQQRNRDR